MTNPHKLFVGQEVWFVPARFSNEKKEFPMTISKVGRVWAETTADSNGYRIHLETLQIDGRGYSSPGRVYTDKDAWEHTKLRERLWGGLCKEGLPKNLSTADLTMIINTIEEAKAK